MHVRPERDGDHAAIHAVHRAAFPSDLEARLVDALRGAGRLCVSLVAEEGGEVVGHIAFSPVSIEGGAGAVVGLGLAPVSVQPAHQGRGVGSALIRDGIERCRSLRTPFVVVLGEPRYYRRFGFGPAHERGIGNEYDARDQFMILEIMHGTVPRSGVARYAEEFSLVS